MLTFIAAYQIAKQAGEFGPVVASKSAIIVDAATGKPLWEHDADTPRFPASTTKIMTALLLIEHCMLDDVIVAPKDIEKIPESSMHLKPGERVTVRNMLYAMMLRSANDGCYAVAKHIAGSVEKFSEMMNARAKLMGCSNTNFCNPNGLHNPKHRVSARDMAIIAREAMRNPVFRDIVRTQKVEIQRSINQKDLLMVNKNRTLAADPTAEGIKTGYTNPAGKCFVGSTMRNGFRLVTTVFKSEDWFADNQQLMNWAFKNFEQKLIATPHDSVAVVPVANGDSGQVSVSPESEVRIVKPKGNSPDGEWRFESPAEVAAPIRQGQRIGVLVHRDQDGFEVRVPAIAGADVTFIDPRTRHSGLIDPGYLAIGVILGAGAWYMRRRSRNF